MVSGLSLQRDRMVQELSDRGIVQDPKVLDALRSVPRHLFVKPHLQTQAYRNNALPIGQGQTISQPFVVAYMTELLRLENSHTVLEVGTGSGYQTAVLSSLAKWVFSLERVAELAQQAIRRMRELNIQNVKIQVFDGTVGWSEMGPYDRILVTAGAPQVPQPLLDQLADKGRMVVPEGDQSEQRLVVYEKRQAGVRRTVDEAVSFVPLLGRHGWQEAG